MRDGEQPYISAKSVQAVLDGILYFDSRKSEAEVLEFLTICDEFLSDPNFPPVKFPRQFAIQHILIDQITHTTMNLCEQLETLQPLEDDTRTRALEILQEHVKKQSSELLAWSTLYYQYVQTHLAITPNEISEIAAIDARTLRRYRNQAVNQLTDDLIHLEWQARKRMWKQRLITQLPGNRSGRLIGREAELQRAGHRVSNDFCSYLYITGAVGIGKTVFVESLVRDLIERGQVDTLIWIHSPPSIPFIYQQIHHQLVQNHLTISAREIMQTQRTVIVLDGVEELDTINQEEWEELIDYLGQGLIIVTSRTLTPQSRSSHNITLQSLNQVEADSLIERCLLSVDTNVIHHDDYKQYIWDTMGGNPMGIRLAVSVTASGDIQSFAAHTLERLYDYVLTCLNTEQQRAWHFFLLTPEAGCPQEPLQQLDILRHIPQLLSYHLVRGDSSFAPVYSIERSGQSYLKERYSRDQAVQQHIHQWLEEITRLIDNQPLSILPIAEHVLLADWLEIDPVRKEHWITRLWKSGIQSGDLVKWHTILNNHIRSQPNHPIELRLAAGICQRRLSSWEQAQASFENIILRSSDEGDFLTQTKALLELAILYRYRSDYATAMQLLNRVERFARQYKQDEILQATNLEYAQIAIDKSDGLSAEENLADLPESISKRVLLCEATLLQQRYEKCKQLANQALKQVAIEPMLQSTLHTVLGRCSQEQNNFSRAIDRFAIALHLVDRVGDQYGVARQKSNLATALIQTGDYDAAEKLLIQARQTQSTLQDRLGLEATQQNLQQIQMARVAQK